MIVFLGIELMSIRSMRRRHQSTKRAFGGRKPTLGAFSTASRYGIALCMAPREQRIHTISRGRIAGFIRHSPPFSSASVRW
jgi:hypothetical protein